ncbi:hypothetical protein ACQY0O_002478 [Thecaphora frezii]
MASNFRNDRLAHFTLAWYTFPMSTGGLALVLMNNSMDLVELRYMGRILYYCNVVLVFAVTAMQVARFTLSPASVMGVLRHPLESVFVGPLLLAYATLINGASTIAGRDASVGVQTMLRVFFWTYTTVSLLQSFVSYAILWNEGKQKLGALMPGWVLPIFPSMLVGTVANAVIPTQPAERAYEIAIAGCTFQGLGFAFSCFMYALLFLRLMTHGLPHVNHRPGLFMCAGPPSFTILALLGMAQESSRFLPANGVLGMEPEQVTSILVVLATIVSIMLWLLAAWWFCFALVSIVLGIVQHPTHMTFVLAWWAFIFPNVGFTIATKVLGEVLDVKAIVDVATTLTVFLMVAWPTVACFMLEGVLARRIMWFGKDEDRDLDEPHHAPAPPAEQAHQPHAPHEEDEKALREVSTHGEKGGHFYPPSPPMDHEGYAKRHYRWSDHHNYQQQPKHAYHRQHREAEYEGYATYSERQAKWYRDGTAGSGEDTAVPSPLASPNLKAENQGAWKRYYEVSLATPTQSHSHLSTLR